MKLPKTVRLVEVSPRDGLQNEPSPVPTIIKLELIDRLANTGLKTIETTSFVTTKKVPQMADAEELYRSLIKKSDIDYPALIPNLKGLERALSVNVESISVFVASSETFSQQNTHCSIAEAMQRAKQVIEIAKKKNIKIRGYISCVLGCPYEGKTDFLITAKLAKTLLELGCYEISLGDTIGVGTPNRTQDLLNTLFKHGIPPQQIAVHFHDTYGQALANIYASLQLAVAVIDASVAGLGGCPYAKGATGNVATEDVLYMLNGLNIETGVDLKKLINTGYFISNYLERQNQSKVAMALKSQLCKNNVK